MPSSIHVNVPVKLATFRIKLLFTLTAFLSLILNLNRSRWVYACR